MIIKESDFELRPSLPDISSPHWDLYVMKTINAKSKTREAREELALAGYGLTLSGALAAIARYRTAKSDIDGALTMQKYLDFYTKELHRLYEIVGEKPNNTTLMEE